MHAIQKRWEDEQTAFAKFQKACEAKVVRWEYWDGFVSHWKPEVEIEEKEKKERHQKYGIIDDPPKKLTESDSAVEYAYGYDAENKLLIIRHISGILTQTEFIRHQSGSLASSTFLQDSRTPDQDTLFQVATGTFAEGQLNRIEVCGRSYDPYRLDIKWADGQIAQIQWSIIGEPPGEEWRFDKNGKMIRSQYSSKTKQPKSPKGTGQKAMEKLIRQRLMSVVPKVIAKAKLKKPVYCLILAYDGEGNGAMPPGLAIGLESERGNWIKSNKRSELKWILWSPDEFEHCESEALSLPDDEKFDQACEWYNQLLEKKGSDKPAHDLLNRIAADLAKLNWKGKLTTTEDFIVFAVDYEGADLKKNFKASVPPKLLAKFKASGWM
jgi:hypothetical protein